jgi:hypothetical protein
MGTNTALLRSEPGPLSYMGTIVALRGPAAPERSAQPPTPLSYLLLET